MAAPLNPFDGDDLRQPTEPGEFSAFEVGLANRNSGILLETLGLDVTPTGLHYLLNHFDVPILAPEEHCLRLSGAFAKPLTLDIAQLRARPAITRRVTMECAGNGRAGLTPRASSMPWRYEAVGTADWTGTLLAPLIAEANPLPEAVEIAFEGLDFGYDKGVPHVFGRSLTLEQIAALDAIVVYEMNGAPLLPQHGAPLRLIVPGWYGMASVKWLAEIRALTAPYDGFQQVRTYRFRDHAEDIGRPITDIRVKSLMIPPGAPDWFSRKRLVKPGPVTLRGRAWSGAGVAITKVEVEAGDVWHEAQLSPGADRYAWTGWHVDWQAEPGHHILRCRATDANGARQPLEPPWDVSGFANNAAQKVEVFVA